MRIYPSGPDTGDIWMVSNRKKEGHNAEIWWRRINTQKAERSQRKWKIETKSTHGIVMGLGATRLG